MLRDMPTGDVSTRGGDDDLLWILQYVELPPDAVAAFTRLLFLSEIGRGKRVRT